MHLPKLYFSIFLLLISLNLQAQRLIKGVVRDFESDLPIANVSVRAGVYGLQTDSLGRFEISIPEQEEQILFSSVAYVSRRFLVKSIPDFFELVVQLSFSQRRKKLINSITSTNLFTIKAVTEALDEAEISVDTRAEVLRIEEFEQLSLALYKRVGHMGDIL